MAKISVKTKDFNGGKKKKKKHGRSLGISIDQNQNVAAFYFLKT